MKRYKKCLLILFAVLGTGNLYAKLQGQVLIDSMLMELPKQKDDTNTVKFYNELSDIYSNYSIDSGILFGEKAVVLANQLNWQKGTAAANYFLGFNYYNKSDYPTALECLFNALKSFEAISDEKGIANTTRKIGNIYRDQKSYSKALECYFKSLKIFEGIGDKLGIGKCYSNIGEIYAFENRNIDAMIFDQKALKIDEEEGYLNGMVITYNRVGDIYNNAKNYQEGLNSKLKALDIAVKNYDRNIIAKEQLQEAYGGVGKCYLNLAKNIPVGEKTNKRDYALQKAIYNLNKAISLVIDMGELVDLQAYYSYLAEAEALAGNFRSAYDKLWCSYLLKDSLFSANNNIKITTLETQREKELKDKIGILESAKKKNETIVVIVGFCVLFIIIGIIARNNKLISAEKKKSDNLLLNILPSEVAEELKAKGSAEAKMIDEVTVLFTDFKGFTQLSEKLSPKALVAEINDCFSAFDLIMQKHGIEKIKTIGDSYMAAGGLPTPNKTHPDDVVKAALEIQQYMNEHKLKKEAAGELFFEIRIGVHTGPVVAGIVGVKKFQYDIWGDTVNTASRMESSGGVGKVNISGATYELVKDKFSCEYRGEVEAKGKGLLKMYYVDNGGNTYKG